MCGDLQCTPGNSPRSHSIPAVHKRYPKHDEQPLQGLPNDLVVYRAIRDQTDVARLQEDMDRLVAWENKWGMKIHPDKCETTIITRKQKPNESSYTLQGHSLKTNKAKYLRVNISTKLEWNPHIKTKVARPTRPWTSLKET